MSDFLEKEDSEDMKGNSLRKKSPVSRDGTRTLRCVIYKAGEVSLMIWASSERDVLKKEGQMKAWRVAWRTRRTPADSKVHGL